MIGKRGQFEISFGMIFSIIIIAATLAVAGYIIVKFVNTGSNVSCKLFYDDFQKRVDKAWAGDGSTQDIFKANAPRGIEKICVGNASSTAAVTYRDLYEEVTFYAARPSSNFFFYPLKSESCGGSGFSYTIQHVSTPSFFCVTPVDGSFSLKISKRSTDALVSVQP